MRNSSTPEPRSSFLRSSGSSRRPETSPKRRRGQRRLRRQGRFPDELIVAKALETQLAYNELLARLKQNCIRWSETHPQCRLPPVLKDRDRLDIDALRDAYADAYRIVNDLVQMAEAEQ